MKVKENAEVVSVDDFWYDLFRGGYIVPEELVDEKDAKKVREAMDIIDEFESALEESELIEWR